MKTKSATLLEARFGMENPPGGAVTIIGLKS
jgi:hypothetical protein